MSVVVHRNHIDRPRANEGRVVDVEIVEPMLRPEKRMPTSLTDVISLTKELGIVGIAGGALAWFYGGPVMAILTIPSAVSTAYTFYNAMVAGVTAENYNIETENEMAISKYEEKERAVVRRQLLSSSLATRSQDQRT